MKADTDTERRQLQAIYEACLRPVKDNDGKPGYFLSVNQATDLRMMIGPVLEKKGGDAA